MITVEEAVELGFEITEKFHRTIQYQKEGFQICVQNDKLILYEWERDEGINVSHLNKEQVKLLISLLTPNE